MLRLSTASWTLLLTLAAASADRQIQLPGNTGWVDTQVDVRPGDVYHFQATGEISYPGAQGPTTPDGAAKGWRDLLKAFPLNDANRGAVIGRIGSGEGAIPFLIGAAKDITMPVAGRLFLNINQPSNSNATGAFTLTLRLVKSGGPAAAAYTGKLPAITAAYFDRIPRRVSDPAGNPGDRVNFVIVGSEDQMKQALKAAGWVAVDKNVKQTILEGALATFSKQAYLTLPMSPLQLFGRSQDYGYAHAVPLQVAAQRHHFRIWKSPASVDGSIVWIGAGTHDTGFDRDQRNNGITHKIDPDTDKEREYIGETLLQSGLVARTAYVTPSNPVTKAKTATGEEFSSDGRILIVWLRPDSPAATSK
jgi:hypothetical protein